MSKTAACASQDLRAAVAIDDRVAHETVADVLNNVAGRLALVVDIEQPTVDDAGMVRIDENVDRVRTGDRPLRAGYRQQRYGQAKCP